VSYESLIAAAWPDSVVEDSNLRVQVNALRRVLDENQPERSYIGNAVGRGYVLLTEVQIVEIAAPPIPLPANKVLTASSAGQIPMPLTRLIGRERDIDDVVVRLAEGPLLTIVGPGGIGKTRVAWAAARRIEEQDGIRGIFADLSSLQRDANILGAVASVLKVDDDPSLPLEGKVVAALAVQPTILVLDNCEHVIEVAAGLVEFLAKSVASLRILATSREPLRCEAEQVFRLSGLSTPSANVPLSAASALSFASIELLVERARAAHRSFDIGDSDVALLAELCRRLDGIPLAIELAAAQLGVLGLRVLVEGIDRRMAGLANARRTAPLRQQTLRATMDWSYETLGAEEARVFEALSVFRASFSVPAAETVVGSLATEVARSLSDLVAKSLVVAETLGGQTKLRLLEVTKTYASGRFDASPHATAVRLSHASYVTGELEAISRDPGLNGLTRHEAYGALIDDARAAIYWTFGEGWHPNLSWRFGTGRLVVGRLPLDRRRSRRPTRASAHGCQHHGKVSRSHHRLRSGSRGSPPLSLTPLEVRDKCGFVLIARVRACYASREATQSIDRQ
jgi:predicted ATPase